MPNLTLMRADDRAGPSRGGPGADPRRPRRPDARSSEAFLLALGTALHREGIPAHRLEAALEQSARTLGTQGQFFSTPTSLYAAFGAPGRQRTALVRVAPGELQLEKLVALDALTADVLDGRLSPARATRRIAAIVDAPDRYGPASTTLAFGLVSASAALLFGGGPGELGASLAVGLGVGLLSLAAARVDALGRVFVPLAATAAAASAALLAWLAGGAAGAAGGGGLAVDVVALSGLIVLVPGLTLTVAMNELATGHLVSGTARLTGALVVFLQLGLGMVVGRQLGQALPAEAAAPWPLAAALLEGGGAGGALPGWAVWPVGALAALGLVVLFRARPRDAAPIVAAALVALAGARLGDQLLPFPGAPFVGALAVGLFGNLYARWARRPSLVPIVPGLLLLVPGSVGFTSVTAMLRQDVLSGIETAFSAGFAAVALAAGLLLANAAAGPRRPY